MSGIPGVSFGIIGCARISRRGLIPGIRASTHGRLGALASRDVQRARSWGQEFAIPKASGSYEELVRDPEIDAVYIPLPNELHLPWVLRAADAGKHVLCEKPLARDGDEAAEMVDHCRSRGVLLMEAFMWRHQPRMERIRELVDGGAIGTLRLVRTSFSFSIDAVDWRLDRARGGGALFDVGCYGVNAARYFCRSELSTARAVARWGGTGVDMSLATSFVMENGVLGAVDCSFEQPYRCVCELVGAEGSLEIEQAFLPTSSARVRLCRRGTDADAGDSEWLEFEYVDQYARMVDAFAESIAAGRLVDPCEDGLNQMRALDAVSGAARV